MRRRTLPPKCYCSTWPNENTVGLVQSAILDESRGVVMVLVRQIRNGKFNDPATRFNRQPSALLVDAIRNRQPGAAIDLGMGQGRNAIYRAQQGWQVTGVDLSDVAVAQAKKRAGELHVRWTAGDGRICRQGTLHVPAQRMSHVIRFL